MIQAEKLNLAPITIPAAGPESNGLSEVFVSTLRRDCLDGAGLPTADRVLERIPGWIGDGEHAPHSALHYKSPAE